jgi:hypothetical protein
VDPIVNSLRMLVPNLTASISDTQAWISIAIAVLIAGLVLSIGAWIARRVGMLAAEAPDGETLGVGLGVGLLVVAVVWATVGSLGRSAFTPIAVTLVAAIALSGGTVRLVPGDWPRSVNGMFGRVRSLRLPVGATTLVGGASFIVAVGLLSGATMAPSPRDGVQPVEFMDEAYYSILGRDVAATGTESIFSPSAFAQLPAHPPQTWYHWGELWLTGATISTFGIDPIFARHYVVLPLILLAAVAMTGTLVRRAARAPSRGAFAFGCVCCLFLAPVPLPGNVFSSWATGMLFSITLYGLAAVVVLILLNLLIARPNLSRDPAHLLFYATCTASLLPLHIVIAILAAVGLSAGVLAYALTARLRTGRLPRPPTAWRHLFVATALILSATVAWGVATGHGIGATGLSTAVAPFNDTWQVAVALTALGSVGFVAMPVAWVMIRRQEPVLASALIGTMALVAFGAVAWGARLGDFTMFHVFFSGIAVCATPLAAVAILMVWRRLRHTRRRLAVALLIACTFQLEAGVLTSLVRLQEFGPHDYEPIPLTVLRDISRLEPDAKLAYACRPFEEVAFWDPRLASIDAHTGRRIVPMCFQANLVASMTGGNPSPAIASPLFRGAPQLEVYPDSEANPSPEEVAAFLGRNGINYIFVDATHPNTLVPDATPISVSGSAQLLRLP